MRAYASLDDAAEPWILFLWPGRAILNRKFSSAFIGNAGGSHRVPEGGSGDGFCH